MGIQSQIGVLRNRRTMGTHCQTTATFFISRSFWASRLDASPENTEIIKTAEVPIVCLEDEIRAHKASVLICDIEGGEADLLLHADLSGIRIIIMETHYWANGRQKIDTMIRFLVTNGFNINLDYTRDHIVVLDRVV